MDLRTRITETARLRDTLARERRARGLALAKVAQMLGIAERTYWRIENGTTAAMQHETIEAAQRLADEWAED